MPKHHDPLIGINRQDLRDKATHTMLDAIRVWAKQMDRLDVLDEIWMDEIRTEIPAKPTPNGQQPVETAKTTLAPNLPVSELITQALHKLGRGTPSEITQYLIEHGIPPKRGKYQLNAPVNWALRAMLEQHRVTRRGKARHTVYSLTT